MITIPEITPYLFKINIGSFPLEIRYYGLLYLVSFVLGYVYGKKNFKYRNITLTREIYDDLIFYIALGVIIGGRVGYMFFYALPDLISNPFSLFHVWKGGMSFHGGAIGVLISSYLYCRKKKINFIGAGDALMPYVAVGLGLGRLGNFINGELFGRVTTLPWGVKYGADTVARHPSQIYEMLLEGVFMFMILQYLLRETKREGIVFWSFFALYGISRTLLEFVRVPDDIASLYPNGLLYGFLPMTQGQFLSGFMIIAGILGLIHVYRKKI